MVSSITVSARVGFQAIHQIDERLKGVSFPIELALPSRYEWWKEAAISLDGMIERLKSKNIVYSTIHATHAKINNDDFLAWGRQTIKIAEAVGAKTITVHPNRVSKKNKIDFQEIARNNLRRLKHNTFVSVAIETFTGHDRIFRPDEIIDANLPMTLDTSHIHDNDMIMRIIDDYWMSIPVVHLSARNSTGQHLPIDMFCIKVVRNLANLGWEGTIVLEYLPWHHYRLSQDVKLIEQALIKDVMVDEISPVCNAYEDREDMWSHNTPPPGS